LKAWQEAMELVKEIYRVTRDFPKEEIYGLVSQMRRAAVSIPSNISEGAARGGDREFIQFLIIARGSLSELETQLLTPHGSVKSFMKTLVFIQRSKKRGILSWLELELCKGSAQAS